MWRRWAAIGASLLLAACAATPELGWQARHAAGEALREAVRFAEEPLPDAWTDAPVTTAPVPINDPALEAGAGALVYAGGVEIRSDFDRLHGLSDLVFSDPLRFLSVSDEGLLVRGRVVLDADWRLVGVEGVAARPLLDPDGLPLIPKVLADAEGMALAAGGELLISFERDHRVWRYDPDTARYRGARPMPAFRFTENEGPEAIAAGEGLDFWMAGENGGHWACGLDACRMWEPPPPTPPTDDDLRVVSMDADPAGEALFVLERAYHAARDTNTIRIRRRADPGRLPALDPWRTLAEFTGPATVDNFEGLAAVRRPDGGVRLYILSDDNFNPGQRTLLLAFDVR